MSKYKILVFGAGSVGAHHINAARTLKSDVFVTDINKEQIIYLKESLYPERYGKWDKKISIINYKNVSKINTRFDLIVLGISPIHHLSELKKCIKNLKFKKILIEKPLFTYNQKVNQNYFKKYEKKIYCGFNHEISESILFLKKYIKSQKNIFKIDIIWKESFKYLLKAHPWVKKIEDSYLSDISKGGGVLHEFSHAVHLTNSLKRLVKINDSLKLESKILFKKNKNQKKYDFSSSIFFKSKNFNMNTYIDGISMPPKKTITISSKDEKCIWERLGNKNLEKITIDKKGFKKIVKIFKINRPKDFITQTKALISNKKMDNDNIKCNNFNNSLETTSLIKQCIRNF